ncbi:hypothetical protein D3C86_2211890 [compost metagenome]
MGLEHLGVHLLQQLNRLVTGQLVHLVQLVRCGSHDVHGVTSVVLMGGGICSELLQS